MLDCLQDSTLGTARIIAAQLCQKFTKTFTTEISEGNTISLECYFRQKIYSTVNYHKGKDLKAKRCILQAFDSVDEDISRPSKVQKKGQYGCAAGQYTPSLPSNDDDLQLLKIKCSNLIKFYKDGVNVKDDRIMTLMKDTYALQRHDIVYSYPCLDDRFFEKWPYLKNYEILFTHASQLIGVENIQEKWKEVLARHNKPIIEFLEAEERIHVLQSRKKQKISSDNLFIRNTIHKANSHAINVSQSNIPLIAVIFPIIIHFFNEEEKLLYMVVDDTLNDEQILNVVEYCTPTLVVKGQSLWDEEATFSIVLNKKCQVQVDELCNGLLLTFLYYYIYNLSYPQKLSRTLEFIQRFFLLINPPKGSKKTSKSRRSESTDLKTQQFIADLTEYIHSIPE
ncbi:uncharacterized protein LOC122851595 [Aphidius gifuensis]|uniref:uncharacterized protein LOC122851595 n=1 Tax=Aphidius gifuensis TaxID=684658 RepID=UPI001CDD6091|nr:uncharacterized protein LOC122851595 [Aphidius gifuensis]